MDSALEVQLHEQTYRIGRLNPRKALHVARRLTPFLGAIVPHLKEIFAPHDGGAPRVEDFFDRAAGVAPALANIISTLKDEDVDYILDTCLSVVDKKQERGWAPVMSHGVMMFQDMDMKLQLQLTSEVVKANLSDFFDFSQPPGSAMATAMTQ